MLCSFLEHARAERTWKKCRGKHQICLSVCPYFLSESSFCMFYSQKEHIQGFFVHSMTKNPSISPQILIIFSKWHLFSELENMLSVSLLWKILMWKLLLVTICTTVKLLFQMDWRGLLDEEPSLLSHDFTLIEI